MGGRNHHLVLMCCVLYKRWGNFCESSRMASLAPTAVVSRSFVRSPIGSHRIWDNTVAEFVLRPQPAPSTFNETCSNPPPIATKEIRMVPCSYCQRGHTFVCMVSLSVACSHGRRRRRRRHSRHAGRRATAWVSFPSRSTAIVRPTFPSALRPSNAMLRRDVSVWHGSLNVRKPNLSHATGYRAVRSPHGHPPLLMRMGILMTSKIHPATS